MGSVHRVQHAEDGAALGGRFWSCSWRLGHAEKGTVVTSPAEGARRSELELPPDVMLDLAHRAAELVVERFERLPSEPAWRGGSRAELEALLREDPPEEGRPATEVLERAAGQILPIASRVDHPRFFAFVPSSATWPGVLADFLCAGHNTFQGTWLGASGPSQLELVVLDWFREWIGYPDTAGGLFTSIGGRPAAHVAQWDGQTWNPLGSGTSGTVGAFAVLPNDTERDHVDAEGPQIVGNRAGGAGVPAYNGDLIGFETSFKRGLAEAGVNV